MRLLIRAFLGGMALLTVGIVIFLYLVHDGVFTPEFGSAAVTSMLVFVTAVSVYLSLLLIDENKTAREREHEPVFTISETSITTGSFNLALENIGNGPAKNVDVTMETKPENIDAAIGRKNIRADEYFISDETKIYARDLPDKYRTVSISGSCEDIFGNEVPIEEEAKIENIRQNTDQVLDRSETEELKREISDLSKSIESIFDSMNLHEVDSLVKMENSRRVIECLEENGPMPFKELHRELGLHDQDITQTMEWMDSAETIEFDKESAFDLTDYPSTVIELTIEDN